MKHNGKTAENTATSEQRSGPELSGSDPQLFAAKDQYVQALSKSFSVDNQILFYRQLQQKLDSIEEGEVLSITTTDHQLLVCKESGRLYLYDPNDDRKGFGVAQGADEITQQILISGMK